jgi:hypothetical protein
VSRSKQARGHLTHVQEQRFRVATTGGPSLLLTLAHDAPVNADDLQQWLREGATVVVDYQGEPGLDSGTAHAVRRA